MQRHMAGIMVLLLAVSPSLHAEWPSSAAKLTLDVAFKKALERHPDLQVLPLQRVRLLAESEVAAQRPALVGGINIENALGTGEFSGLSGAEVSLTLASVLERGGKREARTALATSRLNGFAVEGEATRLDLLAEVARRYLDVVLAQASEEIAVAAVEQKRRTVAGARRRVEAGASPVSVQLAAEAALARAELERTHTQLDSMATRRRLAALWAEREPHFDQVVGAPLTLPETGDFPALLEALKDNPELKRFASEARVREARLQLARSDAHADLSWQVGVRRLQLEGDTALVGSVSLPFGSSARAQPGIRAAEAELSALELERESREFGLVATLAEANGRLVAARAIVEGMRKDVLPRLERAEQAAERAYRAGAISYLEWAQVQADCIQARRAQLDAAGDFQRALIEIQRLTGDPFITAPGGARIEE